LVGLVTNAFFAWDFAWWWWVALIGGVVGLAVSTVWSNRLQSPASPPATAPVNQRNADGTQQVAGNFGQNLDVDLKADRGGTAAWNIFGGVRTSGPGRNGTDGDSSAP
jgi:hypothetical protein